MKTLSKTKLDEILSDTPLWHELQKENTTLCKKLLDFYGIRPYSKDKGIPVLSADGILHKPRFFEYRTYKANQVPQDIIDLLLNAKILKKNKVRLKNLTYDNCRRIYNPRPQYKIIEDRKIELKSNLLYPGIIMGTFFSMLYGLDLMCRNLKPETYHVIMETLAKGTLLALSLLIAALPCVLICKNYQPPKGTIAELFYKAKKVDDIIKSSP